MTASVALRRLCSALVLSLTFAGSATLAHADEGTLTPGQLKVGLEVAYPPFESWQESKIVGFDAELAEMLSKQMGMQLQLVDTKFSGLILGLNAARHDAVISALYITPERTAKADAIPYADTGAYILVAANAPVMPATEQDLCGLTVGLQQGTSWVKKLEQLSTDYCLPQGKQAIVIKEFPTAPETLQALLSGHIQAQVDIAGAVRMFAEHSNGRVKISSPHTIYPQTLGIYVKKDNKALSEKIASALHALRENGQYPRLLQKYQPYGIADTASH